ncbi:hypothetical protein CR513_18726, partial [Mucuna pruriens]
MADSRIKLGNLMVNNSEDPIVQVESESREICNPKIWIRARHADFKSQLLSIARTKISSATIPTTNKCRHKTTHHPWRNG